MNNEDEDRSEIKEKEKCKDTKTSGGGDKSKEETQSGEEESVKVDEEYTMQQEDIKYCDVELPGTTTTTVRANSVNGNT